MTAEWSVPGWAVLATLAVLVAVLLAGLVAAVVVSRRSSRRVDTVLAASRVEVEGLRLQLAAVERRLEAHPSVDEQEYVITRLGGGLDHDLDHDGSPQLARQAADPSRPVPVVDGPLFADLVLREGVVQAASLAAGLRRALAPEHLNRMRFEMRREVKRARKQRRADLRQARREFEARQRAGIDTDADPGGAPLGADTRQDARGSAA